MNQEQSGTTGYGGLFKLAGIGALLAMAANLLDVVLGFGDTQVATYGTKSAVEWFSLFQADGFRGLYELGILNLVYMLCMLPVYLGLLAAHRRKALLASAAAAILFLLALAIYASSSAAIPMYVLAGRYAAAATDAQKALFAAAGEAALARGEDFTPGSFPGLFLSGLAALMVSFVMLRDGLFSRTNAWIGMVGFTFLTLFTFVATFVPSLYMFAFYFFGMIGGLLALAWFLLTALGFFKLARIGT